MFNLDFTGVFQVMLERNYIVILFPLSFLCCGISYVQTLTQVLGSGNSSL